MSNSRPRKSGPRGDSSMSDRPMNNRPLGGGRHGGFGQGGMTTERAKNFKQTMTRLVQSLSKYRGKIIIVFIFSVLATGFMIVGPKIMGNATTILFEGVMAQFSGAGTINFQAIATILLTALGLYLLSSLFSYIMGWIMSGVSADLSYGLRRQISEKINKLPLKFFDQTTHGDVLSRITNDIDTINQTLSQSLIQIITSLVTVLGVVGMMFSIDWRMTLTALLILPLSGLLVGLIVRRSHKYFKQQQEYLGKVNGHVEEMYSGHTIIRAFNGEERSIKKFNDFNEILFGSAWKSQFFSGLMMPLMMFIGNLGYVAVVILGGYLAARRLLTVGDIQAFIQYVRNFTRPLSQIANISSVLQQTAAAAERVYDFLDQGEEPEETETAEVKQKTEGHVVFRNVAFRYVPDVPVIRNFSAEALPGQKIAIVGPTGAGKTTLVKLLMRFYELEAGTISIDGENIREIPRNDLRSLFAMVLQDTWLYNDTLRENIRYGKPDATDQEVHDAAIAAHVDHFIHTLPGGYDMVMNEETSNLSQGQKQLLTIARAILADPKVLILDEATSSVDTRTEILIQRAMDKLMAGRTSFVIAHRLSTIRNADLILVMNHGDIIEQGTHDYLLEQKGFYAELYASQFVPVS